MPQEEQVDEVQAIFPTETPESSLEKDTKLFILEEDDQKETFKLPTLLQKSSQRSLKHKFGETAFATLNSCPENPTVENHLNHNPLKEMILVSPFSSPNIASPPDPFNEELLKEDIMEEWSNGIIDFSEAVWIDSPSITIPCSIRGIAVEAQLIPNIEGNIMPWHLCNTRFIKEHKPSNHIRARIKSHVYTTE